MSETATYTDNGYCFAHKGRAAFTVVNYTDGQEKSTCGKCGAEGFGPQARPQMEDFIVIGHDTRTRHDFEVHRASGESVKDVQDKVAESAAGRTQIIYTVVPVSLHRRFHPQSMLAKMAGQEN